jgi:Quercetinase C-terminal cupin domain
VSGTALREGDGAGVSSEASVKLSGADAAEILVFDLK